MDDLGREKSNKIYLEKGIKYLDDKVNKELGGMVKALAKPKNTKKKRAHSIYTTVPVSQPASQPVGDVDSRRPDEACTVDKVFPDGDKYTGQWVDGCPSGNGKYLWNDGCTYVGGWRKGKIHGRGEFIWPSGAKYKGQFKNGYMNGKGKYRGPNRDTYTGAWLFDMKHGTGTMSFRNKDRYEGEWSRDTPQGQGSYEWKNGNKYVGKWSQGKMDGNGTMTWANGNVYDGNWKNGLPKRNGTFRWAEGSFYVGQWSNNKEEQNGTYYPSSLDEHLDWDPQEVYEVDLADCNVSLCEIITIHPSDKIVNVSPEEKSQKQGTGKPRRASMDERLMARPRRPSDSESDIGSVSCNGGSKRSVGDESEELKQSHIIIKSPGRKGVPIVIGHKHYEFTCNLQLGLTHAKGKPTTGPDVVLKTAALDNKEKKWTKFPIEGSKRTPPHQLNEFKWKDYCPLAFRMLRKLFKVDPQEYVKSLCGGGGALREISSPAKGGSNIYLTNDDKYIIKTMKKAEVKALLKMLPSYYSQVRAFENTLLSKFYGLHCVKFPGNAQKKVRFVIMENLFRTNVIHRCFDLKGSSVGRSVVKNQSKIDSTTTLKDVDLNFIFTLQRSLFEEFSRQLDRDCDFLELEGLMGYSLLLGIHFPRVSRSGEPVQCKPHEAREQFHNANLDSDLNRSGRDGAIRLGINMPACAELTRMRFDSEDHTVRKPTGVHYDVIVHLGIIDILQDYDINKKLQHAYESFQYDPTLISAVSPKQYSRRFREFIHEVFKEET